MSTMRLVVVASVTLLGSLWTAPVSATPELFMNARKQGLPAQSCQYCHVSATPQKDRYSADDLNDRGKWLLTTKQKQQATDVKADWLGQYPGGKEQK
jgi:hypothetical protein